MSKIKLPKQWKDWCRAANLRPEGRNERQREVWRWFYLKGRGFHWRVNCFAEFQRGDTYAEFDRWALCHIDASSLPRTKAEFMATVDRLIAAHN